MERLVSGVRSASQIFRDNIQHQLDLGNISEERFRELRNLTPIYQRVERLQAALTEALREGDRSRVLEIQRALKANRTFIDTQRNYVNSWGKIADDFEGGIAGIGERLNNIQVPEFNNIGINLVDNLKNSLANAIATGNFRDIGTNLLRNIGTSLARSGIDDIFGSLGGGRRPSGSGGGGGGFLDTILGFGRRLLGFQQGGVVPGAPGSPVLALVHGQEEILTPEQRRFSGGDTVIINNNIQGDVTEPVLRVLRAQETTACKCSVE